MEIVKSLEELGLLIEDGSKSIQNQAMNKKIDFLA